MSYTIRSLGISVKCSIFKNSTCSTYLIANILVHSQNTMVYLFTDCKQNNAFHMFYSLLAQHKIRRHTCSLAAPNSTTRKRLPEGALVFVLDDNPSMCFSLLPRVASSLLLGFALAISQKRLENHKHCYMNTNALNNFVVFASWNFGNSRDLAGFSKKHRIFKHIW